jgi:dTDP-4-amino-4,6-dideoxygalactose transaminase
MGSNNVSRRQFLTKASAGTLTAMTMGSLTAYGNVSKNSSKLALLGGKPVRTKSWPDWPYCDKHILKSLTETAKNGQWCRIQGGAHQVKDFQKAWAKINGVKHCVGTGSGTQALHTCVEAMGFGPGDEIITSPYTDPGTISSIISARALPVLADLDVESYQLDPADVEKRITPNTKALMPVHMMGQPCDIESIMAIAKKHNLKVIEDACQGHMAVINGKMLGTIGDVGCFSFQSSKIITSGEGGAIIGNDDELMDKCYTVHNHGTSARGFTETIGPKYRMNEFEGAVLMGQMPGLKERFEKRNANAAYITEQLKYLKGIRPQKLYPGTESGSYYLYTMSYDKNYFDGLSRDEFIRAVNAEGIKLSAYIKGGLHRQPWVDHILSLPVYKKMYSAARLKEYKEQCQCPKCDQVCDEMLMLWSSGPLLADKKDMDDIVNAIYKVYDNRKSLIKA